jgi:hypothetical protein
MIADVSEDSDVFITEVGFQLDSFVGEGIRFCPNFGKTSPKEATSQSGRKKSTKP